MSVWIIIGLAVLIVILWSVLGESKRRNAILARQERRAETLAASDGKRTGFEVSDDVRNLAQQGKRLEALKLYREETGADLDYAISVVDPLLRR